MTRTWNGPTASDHADDSASPRFLPLLLLLFVGSGCAALIYEIVWFQLLQLVIGSSAVSLGVLLGTFMGGMCLGSLLLPRLVPAQRHPLRVYALLEAGIGVLGLAVLLGLPYVARFYVAVVGHGVTNILMRGGLCALCLLPPTLLMGATLPAISRWVQTTPRGVSWLGFFYGGNIAGAVFGCLFAGFYLLRVHDMSTATFVAASINGVITFAALGLATKAPARAKNGEADLEGGRSAPGSSWVYFAIAMSGACALGAEVVWTRLLSLLLGGTVYTFSIILAVFLVGLGLGSSLGAFWGRVSTRPRLALGCCQLFLTVGIVWTAFMLARSLPYWPVNPSLSRSPWFNFQLDLARCFWAILPATVLWGASFPLALAAVASPGQDPGHMVGRVYAANTVGAIVGAVGTSVFLIGWTGTQLTQQVLILTSAAAACLMFAPSFVSSSSTVRAVSADGPQTADPDSATEAAGTPSWLHTGKVWALVAIALGGAVASSVPPIPWKLVAFGRYLPTYNDDRKVLYLGEGMNASVAVTEMDDGVRNFHISGKVEASTDPQDMRLQRMLGHIPALFHPNPRSVLIVGCGAGVTAGSFAVYPGIERIVICELEPLIPRSVTPFFRKENYNVVNDPRVRVIFDDARHYVLTTKEKFDIITSDPIHPWVKGAATLYTKEYFEICRQHLNPGGLITQWVPLYESNEGVVQSELATFFSVFPEATIWSNDENGQGYDTVVLGSAGPLQINVDLLRRKMGENSALAQSLRGVGFRSAMALLSTYAGRASGLAPWLSHAEINRDANLRLQYLAGMASNLYEENAIFDDILAYRTYPSRLFVGSEENLETLRAKLDGTSR